MTDRSPEEIRAERLRRLSERRVTASQPTRAQHGHTEPDRPEIAEPQSRPPRRKHVAEGSRIAITGLSASLMFGLMSAMAAPAPVVDKPATDAAAVAPVQVMSLTPATPPTTMPAPIEVTLTKKVVAPAPAQVVAKATPAAKPAPAPATRTSGSH